MQTDNMFIYNKQLPEAEEHIAFLHQLWMTGQEKYRCVAIVQKHSRHNLAEEKEDSA